MLTSSGIRNAQNAKNQGKSYSERNLDMSKRKTKPKKSHSYTPEEFARLHELYEYMESLSDKDFDKALKKLDRETIAALAAYMTAQNARKGIRLDNNYVNENKPVSLPDKWAQALQLKERFDALDENTAEQELKKLSSDELHSLATVTAYQNSRRLKPDGKLKTLEKLSRKAHNKIDFSDITNDDINAVIDERQKLMHLRHQPNINKKLIDLAMKSTASRLTAGEVTEFLGRERKNSKKPALSTDPEVMCGALVLGGTRIPITTVLDELIAGGTIADFVEEHPSVSYGDVAAALWVLREWLNEAFDVDALKELVEQAKKLSRD